MVAGRVSDSTVDRMIIATWGGIVFSRQPVRRKIPERIRERGRALSFMSADSLSVRQVFMPTAFFMAAVMD
jgi:hypothetical protein